MPWLCTRTLVIFELCTIVLAYLLYHNRQAIQQVEFQTVAPDQWYDFRHDGANLWCGKAYEPQWPAIDPGGRVPVLHPTLRTVLDFRCYTRMNAYFHGESTAEIVFELQATDEIYPHQAQDGRAIYLDDDKAQTLTLSIDGVVKQVLPMAIHDHHHIMFLLPLSKVPTSQDAVLYQCRVHDENEIELKRNAELFHLPPRRHAIGSFSKLDRLTNAVLVNSTTMGEPTAWTPVFPYGFYNAPANLSEMVNHGFNILHVVPGLPSDPNYGYGDDYSDKIAEAARLGIWVMHDMRWSWQKEDLLVRQVEALKDATNLLTWYISDEPDGTMEDPAHLHDATTSLRTIDSRYHVLSSVYNCADFHFGAYTRDMDVIMTDPYPFGMYASLHRGESIYRTTCNSTYGCCGCDHCLGSVTDVATRIDAYTSFLKVLDRRAAIWIVPQGFGAELHWTKVPSQQESLANQLLALNHGVTGSIAWIHNDALPSFSRLLHTTSTMARIVANVQNLLLFGYKRVISAHSSLDVVIWSNATSILLSLVKVEADMADEMEFVLHDIDRVYSSTHLLGTSKLQISSDGHTKIQVEDGLQSDLWLLEM